MKTGTLLILFLLFFSGLRSQDTIFNESFEPPLYGDSVSSSQATIGVNDWGLSSFLHHSGSFSDTCQVKTGLTTFIETNSIFLQGSKIAFLGFSHICKISWDDAAEIEVSTNNGMTWTKLTGSQYLGTGYFSTLGNKFTALSYDTIWKPANDSLLPDNSWWKTEIFNISSLIDTNTTHIKIRFKLTDAGIAGNKGNYGWAIDDILVWTPSLFDGRIIGYELPNVPPSGCGLGNETLKIIITNAYGTVISPGFTAGFQKGNGTVHTEILNFTVIPYDTVTYTFTSKIDFSTVIDTNYSVKAWLTIPCDTNHANDSVQFSVLSRPLLPDPVIADTVIPYGSSVSLHVIHNDVIKWYTDSACNNLVHTGNTFVTPALYDTTTYFVQASRVNHCPSRIIPVTVLISGMLNYDAGVTEIYEPRGIISNGLPYPVKVRIKNFGVQNLTKAVIGWVIDGIEKIPYVWTGNLPSDSVTPPITIGLVSFASGTHLIRSWTALPNDSVDLFHANDTSRSVIYSCLEGNFTIGGQNADFATIQEALAILDSIGVCGNTVFNINPGIYTGNFTINPYSGINSTNQVTFQSTTGINTDVIIQYEASGASNNWVVRLNNAEWINFRNLTLKANDSSYATVVELVSSDHTTFENCVIESFSSLSNNAICVNNITSLSNYNTFRQCKMLNGNYAFNFTGANSTNLAKGNVIENCEILNFNTYGIYLNYHDSVIVRNNLIRSNPLSASVNPWGIYINYCDNGIRITANKVEMITTYTAYGIYMYNCQGTAVSPGLIANNFIVISSPTGSSYGLYVRSSNYQNIYYNSVSICSGNAGSRAFNQNSGLNLNLANNIFSNEGGGYAYYVLSPGAITYSDYNNYYTSGSSLAYWISIKNTLANLQATNGMDIHSLSVLPGFADSLDLHLNNMYLDGAATPLFLVDKDFDGQPRDTIHPDIGADEYLLLVDDIGIAALYEPVAPCHGSLQNIKVVVKNFGTDTVFSGTIKWKLNNVLNDSINFTYTLCGGDSVIFLLDTMTFYYGINYNFEFWTCNPNGIPDFNQANDTLKLTSLRTALAAGNYSIGPGAGKDYANFTLAVDYLKKYGVCGPVVFNVDAGIYNEQLVIPQIPGSSPTNTITFRSAGGDSTTVKLTFSPASDSTNYVLKLDGADYLRFQKMTIKSGGTYGGVVELWNSANRNSFTGNILESIQSSNSKAKVINDRNSLNQYNEFIQNRILYGYYGIYSSGASSTNRQKNTVIRGNKITGFNCYGICINYHDSVEISANLIDNSASSDTVYGIFSYYSNSFRILRNNIQFHGISEQYGVFLLNCSGTVANYNLMANNFISQSGGSGVAYGIYHNNSNYCNYYYNSMNLTGGSSSESRSFYQNGGSNINLKNNIYVNTAGGFALYISAPAAILSSDYNNYYTGGQKLGYWLGNVTSLNALQLASGKDQHSRNFDPYFTTINDLHVNNGDLFGIGIPLPGIVTDDIDGEVRDSLHPCIGADEFLLPLHNGRVTTLFTLGKFPKEAGSPHVVSAIIENRGMNDLPDFKVFLAVSGTNNFNDTVTIDTLFRGQKDTVYFSPFSPVNTGPNSINVYISLDDDNSDNVASYYQLVTDSVFSYADTAAKALNAGYNTASGLILAKYHMNGIKLISRVNAYITGAGTLGQKLYAVVLDKNGNILSASPVDTIDANQQESWVSFPVTTPVATATADDDFYVGIAQTAGTTGCFPVGAQLEDPVRPGAYFSGNISGGILTENPAFARLMIEAVTAYPLNKDAKAIGFTSPTGGCGLTSQETVILKIQNLGTDTIFGADSTLTVSYMVDNDTSTLVTAYILSTIPPSSSYIHTFNTPADLSVSLSYHIFEIKGWVKLNGDPFILNDTIVKSVNSYYRPPDPVIISPITIQYNTSAVISASSPDSIYWYATAFDTIPLVTGPSFTTPVLYDTVTYWVEARSGRAIIKITEITQFKNGLGATMPYPSWLAGNQASDFDGLEITNLGNNPADISGFSMNFYSPNTTYGVNGSWTFPAGVILAPGEVCVLDIKSTAGNDPAHHYYVLGMSGNLQSNTEQCYYLKNKSGSIVDAVATNGATFIPSTGVGASDWLGSIPSSSGKAGVSRIMSDNNVASDWVVAGSGIPVQTIGSLNPQLNSALLGGQGCISNRIPFVVQTTSPPGEDAGVVAITNPVVSTIASVPTAVKVKIKNYGTHVLNSVIINHTVNGMLKSPYTWTGSLMKDSVSAPVVIATDTFTGGYNCLKVWTSLPNGIIDTIPDNDTVMDCFNACMSGVFSLGTPSSDFPTFNHAIISLDSAGICGPVTFNVAPGIYVVSQLLFREVNGASDVNTITFQAANGDSTSVIIYGAGLSDSTNYVIKLNGADYFRFKHLSIKTTSLNFPGVIELANGAKHNEFSNCIIESTANLITNARCIYDSSSLNEYNLITYNRIKGGYYGIYLSGTSLSQSDKGNFIENNIIEGFNFYGLYLSYQDSVIVRNNLIKNSNNANTPRGIYANACNNAIEITGNRLEMMPLVNTYGLYMHTCTGTITKQGLIANNFISVNGGQISATNYGIYSTNSVYQNFYYNSISINDSSASSRCIHQALGSDINFANNILANTGGGFTYYVTAPTSIVTADYNDLYATGNILAYWNGNQINLSALQTASGKEAHSVSLNPLFVSSTDLHVGNYNLDSTGTPLFNVLVDIDGDIRDLNYPDIGADEFKPSSVDAGIQQITEPVTVAGTGLQNVKVTLINHGIDTLTSVTIAWSVNEINQTSYNWTGSLGTGDKDTGIVIGQYNVPVGEIRIKVWTSNPNGQMDDFPTNDTAMATVIACAGTLSGVFTIGGTNADFSSFTNAYFALTQCNIGGQVTFNVAPGTYNEQLVLTQVVGVSPTNKIIFQGSTGDSSDVVLSFGPSTSANNYVVYLNGADYVTFRCMTIASTTDTVFGRVIVLDNGADFNEFSNNSIESITGNINTSACFYSNDYNDSYLTIKNNLISKGYYGLFLTGASQSTLEQGLIIEKNQIKGFYAYGAYLRYQDAVKVLGNIFENAVNSADVFGLYLESCANELIISKNNIKLNGNNTNYNLFMRYCDGTSFVKGVVKNNFMSVTGNSASANYGIVYDTCHHINFYYNSINITAGSTNSVAFRIITNLIPGQSDVNIQNNILRNGAGGYTYDFLTLVNIGVSDYNDLYTTGSILANWNGIANNLNTLKTLSGKEAHSVSVDPGFVSNTDLHISTNAINGLAAPIPGINDDIDGNPRSPNTPDIGADEFTLNVLDIGITAFAEPSEPFGKVGTLKNIKVVVKNFGTNIVGNFNIGYKLPGMAPVIETFTGTLSMNMVDTFSFAAQMNPIPGQFSLCAFTLLSGDQNHANDTFCLEYFGIPTLLTPYSENFEGTNHYWYSRGINNEWELGLPVASVINSAHSPVNAWATNLNGYYMNNSLEYLYSPMFNISVYGIGYLKFWQWFDTENPVDGGRLQYLNNQGNWITLGIQNDSSATNWYNTFNNGQYQWSGNSGTWIESIYDLVGIHDFGAVTQFRFVFNTNALVFNYDGWAIDDFELTPPKLPKDAGIVSILSPLDSTVLGTTVTVKVVIKNFGSDTLTSIPVRYVLDGGAPVVENYSGVLIPNGTASFTFNTTFPAPTVPDYTLCVYTRITGDTNYFNDTLCRHIIKKLPDYDAGVQYIVFPVDSTLWDTTYTVKVRIKNYGLKTLTSIPVIYVYDTNPPVVENWTGSLPSGYSVNYFFNQAFNPGQGYKTYSLCLYTALPNDGYPVNDTVCESINNVPVDIDEPDMNGLWLGQNIPNPGHGFTIISYSVPLPGEMVFCITNLVGEVVFRQEGRISAGMHTAEVNVSSLPSGLYFYSLKYMNRSLVRKMIISN